MTPLTGFECLQWSAGPPGKRGGSLKGLTPPLGYLAIKNFLQESLAKGREKLKPWGKPEEDLASQKLYILNIVSFLIWSVSKYLVSYHN